MRTFFLRRCFMLFLFNNVSFFRKWSRNRKISFTKLVCIFIKCLTQYWTTIWIWTGDNLVFASVLILFIKCTSKTNLISCQTNYQARKINNLKLFKVLWKRSIQTVRNFRRIVHCFHCALWMLDQCDRSVLETVCPSVILWFRDVVILWLEFASFFPRNMWTLQSWDLWHIWKLESTLHVTSTAASICVISILNSGCFCLFIPRLQSWYMYAQWVDAYRIPESGYWSSSIFLTGSFFILKH